MMTSCRRTWTSTTQTRSYQLSLNVVYNIAYTKLFKMASISGETQCCYQDQTFQDQDQDQKVQDQDQDLASSNKVNTTTER